jgi:hypothetical protein
MEELMDNLASPSGRWMTVPNTIVKLSRPIRKGQ